MSDAFFFPLRTITERLDWREVFSLSSEGGPLPPIEVDLGCGDGEFLSQLAKSFPDRNFLGVERLKGRARKAARKLARAGLTNARVLRIESGYAVQWLFPPESVAAAHILFPDPWPKRRHWRRRLMKAELVAALHRALVPCGEVHFATDSEEYFCQTLPLFGPGWLRVEPLQRRGQEWRTEFERAYASAGKPIHRARWVKQQ